MRIITNCLKAEKALNTFFNNPEIIKITNLDDLLKVDIEKTVDAPAVAVVLDAYSEDFLSLMLFVVSGATLTCPVYIHLNNRFIPVPCPYESDVWIPVLRGTLNALLSAVSYYLRNHAASDKVLKEEFESLFDKVEKLKALFYERVSEEVRDATEKLL
ncbi:MAG: hypothetical protein KatS3mg087_0068 [Patescibacteria group bacterium]|nr:MAG: hypothetical protein KatS3mg087_0068 [Patescibacteria group bacterium]